MVFNTIRRIFRPILEGRDDANAAIAHTNFLAAMETIESFSPIVQKAIAYGVEHAVMDNIAEDCRKYLPAHCHQEKDFLIFADSRGLKAIAEHYFSQAATHSINADTLVGVSALELVGFYLLARSWQDLDHSINIDAPGLGARMIGLDIESRICAFLKKEGRSLPRGC